MPPRPYAENTKVSIAESQRQIEQLLERHGATQFVRGWDGALAVIGFEMRGRRYKLELPLPNRNAPAIQRTPERNIQRTPAQIQATFEQAQRQRCRALHLVIKAKLEAVEAEIRTIEQEFMSDTVMADGRTVNDWIQPQLEQMYVTGKMPPLLPGPKD